MSVHDLLMVAPPLAPGSTAIAVVHSVSPFIAVYPWSSAGFGTKFADPGTLPGTYGYGVAFSHDGNFIAVAAYGSPYLSVSPWSSAGFGTRFAEPGDFPDQRCWDVAFCP